MTCAALLLGALATVASGCGEEEDRTAGAALSDPRVLAGLEQARAEGWEPRYDDLLPVGAASEWVTEVTVYGVSLGVPLLLALVLSGIALRAEVGRRRAAGEARAAATARTLRPGPAMIHGTVHVEDDGDAVSLELEQVGIETKHDKSWKTRWTETARRVEARPFTIELADGRRVPVEPRSDATRLVDDLSAGEMVDREVRVRRARLQAGETVYASGVLETAVDPLSGYRGEGERLVLRPPARGAMLLSTRPLDETFRWRRNKALLWAVLSVSVAGLAVWGLHMPYLAARHGGFAQGTAVVAGKSLVESDDDDDSTVYYLVSVIVAETGQVFPEALEPVVQQRAALGDRMPVIYDPDADTPHHAQLGTRPAMYDGKAFESLILLLLFLGVAFWRRGHGRSWYAQERLVEKESGRLPPYPPPETRAGG